MIEHSISNMGVLKDEALITSIEQYARNIFNGHSNENAKLWEAQRQCGHFCNLELNQ
jgi:hypothetical protein